MIGPSMPVQESTSTAWNDQLLQNPHTVADKRSRVQKMFAAIAPTYDLNNRLHSLWMDQRWRNKAVKLAELKAADEVVDVACGTGDLSWAFARLLGMYGDGFAATGSGFGYSYPSPRDPWIRIDRILADKKHFHFRSFEVINQYISDHYAITSELELVP